MLERSEEGCLPVLNGDKDLSLFSTPEFFEIGELLIPRLYVPLLHVIELEHLVIEEFV